MRPILIKTNASSKQAKKSTKSVSFKADHVLTVTKIIYKTEEEHQYTEEENKEMKQTPLTAQQFIQNIQKNISKKFSRRKDSIEQMTRIMEQYINQIEPTDVMTASDEEKDIRLVAYYVLAAALISESALPAKYKKFTIEFEVPGWPRPTDEAWLQCIKALAAVVKQARPELNFEQWTSLSAKEKAPESEKPEDELKKPEDEPKKPEDEPKKPEDEPKKPEDEPKKPKDEPKKPKDEPKKPKDEPKKPKDEPKKLERDTPVNKQFKPQSHKTTISCNNYDFNKWKAPASYKKLIQSIKQMHAYGRSLERESAEKSTVVMNLAINLFNKVKTYHEATITSQDKKTLTDNFKKDFKKELNSQNEIISKHRKLWKVIVANILLALTGLGLIAMAFNRGTFFSDTKSKQLQDSIQKEFNKNAPAAP